MVGQLIQPRACRAAQQFAVLVSDSGRYIDAVAARLHVRLRSARQSAPLEGKGSRLEGKGSGGHRHGPCMPVGFKERALRPKKMPQSCDWGTGKQTNDRIGYSSA